MRDKLASLNNLTRRHFYLPALVAGMAVILSGYPAYESEQPTVPYTIPFIDVAGSLTGHRHVAAYTPDSRLVVAFRDMAKNSPNWGCCVAWIGTYDDIISGREGQHCFKTLHQAAANFDCGYSGLECLPDGTMVVTTYVKYRPGPEKNSIVSVRFKLDEIDEKARQMN